MYTLREDYLGEEKMENKRFTGAIELGNAIEQAIKVTRQEVAKEFFEWLAQHSSSTNFDGKSTKEDEPIERTINVFGGGLYKEKGYTYWIPTGELSIFKSRYLEGK